MRGLILATIGTPQDTSQEAVTRYLSSFLGDRHVISIPQPFRKRLVENIIIPRRIALSTQRYQALQTLSNGELPLRKHMREVVEKMRLHFPDLKTFSLQLYSEEHGLAYLLKEMKQEGDWEEITILPLYPQQTVSSYNAVIDAVLPVLQRSFPRALLSVVPPFYAHDEYIQLLHKRVATFLERASYDLLVASFHSIPLVHQWWGKCFGYDYRKQCQQTSEKLFQSLSCSKAYRTFFQSAIGKKWLRPFTENAIPRLPKEGIKRILVVCPGFLMDCLETVFDLGETLRQQFMDAGGESFDLVPALNSDEDTIAFFYQLATLTRKPH